MLLCSINNVLLLSDTDISIDVTMAVSHIGVILLEFKTKLPNEYA
jgi:hypothetical protein